MAVAALMRRTEVEKGITIGSAYAWGAGLGGITRVSPKAASVMEFGGAIGGLIGAMIAPPGLNDLFEGIACGSGALLGLGLTSPTASRRLLQARGEETATNRVERLMLKEGGAAKEIMAGHLAQSLVGAGVTATRSNKEQPRQRASVEI